MCDFSCSSAMSKTDNNGETENNCHYCRRCKSNILMSNSKQIDNKNQ